MSSRVMLSDGRCQKARFRPASVTFWKLPEVYGRALQNGHDSESVCIGIALGPERLQVVPRATAK